jgi:hypothetical protein
MEFAVRNTVIRTFGGNWESLSAGGKEVDYKNAPDKRESGKHSCWTDL